jgi:hypothetical protein
LWLVGIVVPSTVLRLRRTIITSALLLGLRRAVIGGLVAWPVLSTRALLLRVCLGLWLCGLPLVVTLLVVLVRVLRLWRLLGIGICVRRTCCIGVRRRLRWVLLLELSIVARGLVMLVHTAPLFLLGFDYRRNLQGVPCFLP